MSLILKSDNKTIFFYLLILSTTHACLIYLLYHVTLRGDNSTHDWNYN